MAKSTMGTKLPRKLEQKMALMGEQIKLATLLTGTVKLLTPVRIPHLGLWHYGLGIAMSIAAIIHLIRGIPSWNRLRKAAARN